VEDHAGAALPYLPVIAINRVSGSFETMFRRIAHAFHEWRERAHTIDELSRLSDAQLRDIGIPRSEIHAVARRRRR
jgi:uncharacterized protein YjiS (DUF1127 family)